MWLSTWVITALVLGANASAVGKAWEVSNPSNVNSGDRPTWPRLDSASASSSAFEVRSISGVGHLPVVDPSRKDAENLETLQNAEEYERSRRAIEDFSYEHEELIEDPRFEEFPRSRRGLDDVEELRNNDAFRVTIDEPLMHHFTEQHIRNMKKQRIRRNAEDELGGMDVFIKDPSFEEKLETPRFRRDTEQELEEMDEFIQDQFLEEAVEVPRFRRDMGEELDHLDESLQNPVQVEIPRSHSELDNVEELKTDNSFAEPLVHHSTKQHVINLETPRSRRDAEEKLEKISGVKSVREARLNSPETWSKQPMSIEFRHHTNLDQIPPDNGQASSRSHQAPKADFVTSHRRDYAESRESREMPVARDYNEDMVPLYQEKMQRDFDVPIPRSYYPDRFRSERDFYPRRPIEPPYMYNRYNEEDVNPYARAYPSPKPKRIIYYATLPEVVRKPVDLRSYRHLYDNVVRSPAVAVASSSSYQRVPGNVDPNRFRYRPRYPYDSYESYPSRDYRYNQPFAPYRARTEEEHPQDRAALREGQGSGSGQKLTNQINGREEARLPWPVQIGTEVNVKDDGRISGRKIFGQVEDYGRYQNAQLQKATEGGNEEQHNN